MTADWRGRVSKILFRQAHRLSAAMLKRVLPRSATAFRFGWSQTTLNPAAAKVFLNGTSAPLAEAVSRPAVFVGAVAGALAAEQGHGVSRAASWVPALEGAPAIGAPLGSR